MGDPLLLEQEFISLHLSLPGSSGISDGIGAAMQGMSEGEKNRFQELQPNSFCVGGAQKP